MNARFVFDSMDKTSRKFEYISKTISKIKDVANRIKLYFAPI
jgi:hypothetical protein